MIVTRKNISDSGGETRDLEKKNQKTLVNAKRRFNETWYGEMIGDGGL